MRLRRVAVRRAKPLLAQTRMTTFARKKKRDAALNLMNRLGGPETVEQTGPPLDTEPLSWFPEFSAAFAISIRPRRWMGMRARLGPWAHHVHMWPGTNGLMIDAQKWMREGKSSFSNGLNRGQLGCYDSHVRLWERIVHEKYEMTLVMEDDANLRHTKKMYSEIRTALNEVKQLNQPWHILYLGRSRSVSRGKVSPHLVTPAGCCGLYAYVLSLEGAQMLLKHAKPYYLPVDVLVAQMHDSRKIVALALEPSLCYVVPVHSDTRHIV